MNHFRSLLLASSVLAAISADASAQALLVGPNVNINRQTGYQAEVSITIDRSNPNNVFAWSNDVNGFSRNSAAFSTNGGVTWTSRFTGSDGFPALGGDPTSSSDQFGNIYGVSFNSGFTGAIVGRSTNGGQTFTNLGTITIGDQPTVVAGQSAVWLTYQNTGGSVALRGASSTALGVTGAFGVEQVLASSSGGNFGDVAIGPGGRVAVGYQNPSGGSGPSTIFVHSNLTGLGGSFGAAGAGVATNVGGFRSIPAQPSRTVDAEMGLAYDTSGGPRNGRLYLVYTDAPTTSSNDLNIFVRSSTNDGASWSSPVRVNTDVGSNSQFFPKIALDSVTGNIAVVWYDARNSGTNQNVELWGTVSTDGGLTFLPEVKISAGQTRGIGLGGGNELGDYIGLDYYNNVIMPAWTDTSNSTGDNPNGTTNSDYYTARVLFAVPEPATFALMGTGIIGTGIFWLRRRQQLKRQLEAKLVRSR